MQRLLMIAYYFPPLGGAGVQRSAKFAKYLARMGWQIEVVSVEPPSFEPTDHSLEINIAGEKIRVHRVHCRSPFRSLDKMPGGWRFRAALEDWFLFPDRMQGWRQAALDKAKEICAEVPGIPVMTTSAPYTAHLIGLQLKKECGMPWIADFRDEWSQNPYLKTPTAFHLIRHRAVEKKVLQQADAVVSVTPTITDGLQLLVPDSKAIFRTIPNGFDPEDLRGVETERDYETFTLTHVGTLNGDRLRLLQPLLDTLKCLVAECKIRHVKLKLVGNGNWDAPELAGNPWIESVRYLPHAEALKTMAQSDLVILAESNPAAFTGKIFEYLGLRLPVLGFVHPESPAARLICEAEAGWVIGLNTDEGLAEIIINCYQTWREGKKFSSVNDQVLRKYNRERQAGELAELIEKVSGPKSDPANPKSDPPSPL